MSPDVSAPTDDLCHQVMIEPADPTAQDRARRRRLVASAVTIGIAGIAVTSLTTSALFSDQDSATADGFTTGSVNLTLGLDAFAVQVDDLVPGDTQYRSLTVHNAGSLAYRYAVSKSAPTDGAFPLAGVLELAAFALPAGTECSATTAVSTTEVSHLATISSSSAVFGSADTGFQPGDRELDSTASEQLCFQITLPSTVDSSYQGAITTVSLNLVAEQIANN